MSYVDKTSPARQAAAVTPSDATQLGTVRALYVGTTGDLAVLMRDDDTAVTLPNVPAGAFLPLCVQKVMSTGTTASDIVAFY